MKHLEPFEFHKVEDIPVAFYFPSLALGWLLLHSAGVLCLSPSKEPGLDIIVLGFWKHVEERPSQHAQNKTTMGLK